MLCPSSARSTRFVFFALAGALGGLSAFAGTIIVGAGPGGLPQVGAFNARTDDLVNSIFAYNPNFTGGVSVAAGYINGQSVIGAAPGRRKPGGQRFQRPDSG